MFDWNESAKWGEGIVSPRPPCVESDPVSPIIKNPVRVVATRGNKRSAWMDFTVMLG